MYKRANYLLFEKKSKKKTPNIGLYALYLLYLKQLTKLKITKITLKTENQLPRRKIINPRFLSACDKSKSERDKRLRELFNKRNNFLAPN